MRRPRARLSHDDMIVCHRAAYSHISPQMCVDKHVKNEEACGTCNQSRYAARDLAEAMDTDIDTLVEITRNGRISQHSHPLVKPESLPEHRDVLEEEKGKKDMNTRVVFINGRRMPQGIIGDFRATGGLSERYLMLAILVSTVESLKVDIRDIAVDEYYAGRLSVRYEWSANNDNYGPKIDTKIKHGDKEHDAVGFRLLPVTTDSYTRG